MITHCALCGGQSHTDVFSCERAPLLPFIAQDTAAAATNVLPKFFGPLSIVACDLCGHLYNRSFDVDWAKTMYEGSIITNKPVDPSMFNNLEQIAVWLGEDQYVGKNVVEIGAGSGHFARLLARLAKHVTVFEPSSGLESCDLPEPNITLVSSMFKPGVVPGPCDLLICRQVLEHLDSPQEMLQGIRTVLADSGIAYLEVPRADYIEQHALAIGFHTAHVQYYHLANFEKLLERNGFVIVRSVLLKEGHDMGFLVKKNSAVPGLSPIENLGVQGPEALRQCLHTCIEQWDRVLGASAQPLALYGATYTGAAFLSLHQARHRFRAVFDDNQPLWGKALYGKQGITAVTEPTTQSLQQVGTLVVTSYLHTEAISKKVRGKGFSGSILAGNSNFSTE